MCVLECVNAAIIHVCITLMPEMLVGLSSHLFALLQYVFCPEQQGL